MLPCYTLRIRPLGGLSQFQCQVPYWIFIKESLRLVGHSFTYHLYYQLLVDKIILNDFLSAGFNGQLAHYQLIV